MRHQHGKAAVLKNDEMVALLRRTKDGDQDARQQLICGNLRLVLSVIQRFAGRGESADDLFQVGCIGLIKAIDNFDVSQPSASPPTACPRSSAKYAATSATTAPSASAAVCATPPIRCSAPVKPCWPTPSASHRGADRPVPLHPREEVVFSMDALSDPVSLYDPVYADGSDALCVMDQVRDDRCTDEHWLDRIALKDAIARLDDRQRSILALRFCQGKTQMEVSTEIGMTSHGRIAGRIGLALSENERNEGVTPLVFLLK